MYGDNDGKDMNNYIEQSTIFATVIMHSELRGNAIPFLIITHPLCTGGRVTKRLKTRPFRYQFAQWCIMVKKGEG